MDFITIPNFSELSQQEIFDIAVRHIGSTGVRSYDNTTRLCVYSDTGCNAAPFIRPECRTAADTYGPWRVLCEVNKVPDTHLGFMIELQHAHDNCVINGTFKQEYHARMHNLARYYKLNTAELDKLGWDKA